MGTSYEYSKRFAFRFGYRYMSIAYDKSKGLYDMTMQGPVRRSQHPLLITI